MTDYPDYPRERRPIPASLRSHAAQNPGGYVAEIDKTMIGNPDGYVPNEAILGLFCIGTDGQATGEFIVNPHHGQVKDDFRLLEDSNHWLGWMPDKPALAIRKILEEVLNEQVAGSVLDWVKVLKEPVFLTSGIRSPQDSTKIIVRRTALAIVFALAVRPPSEKIQILTGAFSWVVTGLNQGPRRDRTWLDLGMTRIQAEQALEKRIFEDEGTN
ncbi:MAG: hypothetical protein LBG99_08160 [Propionibacteriaceae bacterium]|jgi:hypothetical protein|nr:hypothetical protein [Propionibacteriaceae bacterium]